MLTTVIDAYPLNRSKNHRAVHEKNSAKRLIANQRPHHLALAVKDLRGALPTPFAAFPTA
uniref:Uncharacterized protein n=1 Tax=Paraburkholderia sprentiae WSM5005 TaxID=754502 RepID=A0A1I9YV22_9BURK